MKLFRKDYELKNKSGFLNRIYKNYHKQFPLAPEIVLKNIPKVNRKFKDNEIERVIKMLVDEFKIDTMKSAIDEYKNKYPRGVNFKLKLSVETTRILKDYKYAHYFEKYSPRKAGLGFYLKIMFESYAQLPNEERENIYFCEEIKMINRAIKQQLNLRLTLDGERISLVPIKLIKDLDKSYYVLHLLKPIENIDKVAPIEIVTLKLNNLQQLEIGQKSKQPTQGIIDMVISEIYSIIPHYNSAKSKQNIKVKFDSSGYNRFNQEENELNIVGIPVAEETNTFIFNATESEIFWYIFKYGGQAQILEPITLRTKFKKFYEYAAKVYKDMEKESSDY
jgi:hypothetical protein